jgi:DNA replication protein DnaC
MEYTVMMTSLPKILEIPGWKDEGKSEVFCEPDLLVIDDFGVERGTEYSLERAYEVIDTRVRSGKPLIITTNLSVADVINEEAIGRRRIYDRILEGCVPLTVTGSSFRKDKAVKNQKDLMRLLSEKSAD